MQQLAGKTTVRPRPFVNGLVPVRPVGRSMPARLQQRVQTFAVAEPTAADVREVEELSIEQDADTSSAALPAGNVKLRVRMRGYDIGILAKACEQIKVIATLTGAKIAGPVMLPTKKRVYCVLRSPHVNKDAREHFEIRIHNRLVDVGNLSAQTVQALMEWVPPSGLEVETSIV
eukprot:gene13970-14084_t